MYPIQNSVPHEVHLPTTFPDADAATVIVSGSGGPVQSAARLGGLRLKS